jgi:hypothetical protein
VKKAAFRELIDREYRYYQHIYTDGSKMDEKTGYAVVTLNQTLKIRLANEASVYTAELSAISWISPQLPKFLQSVVKLVE